MQLKKSLVYRFFFKKENCTTIGILRILVASVLLFSLINDLPFVTNYFSDEGVLSGHTEFLRHGYRFTVLDYFGSPIYILIFYSLLIASTLSLLLGKYTRFSAIAAFILLSSFHEKNPLVLNSGDTLMRLMLFYLILAPSGKCFSLDSRKKHKTGQQYFIWPRRLIQIQLALVYLFAFLPKSGATWRNGTAVYYFLANSAFARFNFEFLGNYMGLVGFMTSATLLIELLFPILIWFKSTRNYMLFAGILLQSSILITSNITFFSLIMIVVHLAFVEPETVNKIIDKLSYYYKRFSANLFNKRSIKV